MLLNAISNNVLVIFVFSIFFMAMASNKKTNLRKLRRTIILFMPINFFNFYVGSGLVDLSWGSLILAPIWFATFIIQIIAICRVSRKIKQPNDTDFNEMKSKKYGFLVIIPILIFMVPYLYELYILNNCSYLIHSRYESGFNSADYYYAIIHDKPVEVSLTKNLLFRTGNSTEEIIYNVDCEYDLEIAPIDSNEEHIRYLTADIKDDMPYAERLRITYLQEGKYSIVCCSSDFNQKWYFYHGTTYITEFPMYGEFKTVTFYK